MYKRVMAALAAGLLALTFYAHAEEETPLIFGTAPTSSPEDTKKAYAAMIEYLNKATGRKIVLQTAVNYVEYQVKLRQGAYDLMFDGPPFVSWRMVRQQHVPLVRLPADIRMVVIKREDAKYTTMDELAIYNVATCTVPSPNTLTLIFLSYFPHPARQPHLLPVEGFKKIEECVRSGKGEVAVFRDSYWKNMDQTGLKVMFEPDKGYPERTITAGPKVSPEVRGKIVEALTSDQGAVISRDVLSRFKRDKFIKANPGDYAGLDQMLLPVWGFF